MASLVSRRPPTPSHRGHQSSDAECVRLAADTDRTANGSGGEPTWPSASGARSVRITPSGTIAGVLPARPPRSRVYRWDEDRLLGFTEQSRVCFALALGNVNDPILEERLFGRWNAGARDRGLVAGIVLVGRFARSDYVREHRAHDWAPKRLGWR